MTVQKLSHELVAAIGAILGLLVLSPTALAQGLPQDPVYSANATITYGSSFTPSYSGGDGTGAWQFAVSGYTTDTQGDTSDAGTYYSSNWYSSWTPPAPGTYYFTVVNDGDDNWAPSDQSSSYTLTVNQESQASVSSSTASVTYGSSFTPSYSGGSGTGGWQFCFPDYTDWQSSAWTPPGAGSYSFYVQKLGDTDYAASSNAGPYTLTVNKAGQAGVSSSNATINFDGSTQSYPSFTPSYSGGSGTGGWQFCIGGYTNWDGGITSYTGTSSSGDPDANPGSWSSSWTPSAPGTYTFWVARDEDSNYTSSSVSSGYTLTVNGPVDGIQWNEVNLPSSGVISTTITFTASVTNTGSSYWGSNYELEAVLSGTEESETSISGVYPTDSTSPTFSLTLPSTAGTYTYAFAGLNTDVGTFGTTQYASIVVNLPSAPVITSASTASGTYDTSFSYSITASTPPSYPPTSYGASNLPPGLSVNTSTGVISGTPTSVGTGPWTTIISATNTGGTGYGTVTITINPLSASFSASPTYFTYDGSSKSPTITASPSGATYSTSEGTESTEGSYTLSITATGNYSGSASIGWSIGPSAPTSGTSGSGEATTFVDLTWSASSSAAGGVYYKIYNSSGTQIGTSATNSFVIGGLSDGDSYSFTVKAFDAAGYASPALSISANTYSYSGISSESPQTMLGINTGTTTTDTSNSTLQFYVLRPQ